MDQCGKSALKLWATTGVDGGRGSNAPHDVLADVGRDEERDTRAQTIALLEELVEKNDNKSSSQELDNEKNADTGAEICWGPVETSEHVDTRLAEGQDDGEELLGGLVEFAVRLEIEVDIDEVGAGKELEDHAGGYNGCDSQLHQCTTITRHHHT